MAEIEELQAEIEKLTAKNRELIGEVRKAKGSTNEEAARLAAELDEAKAENAKLAASLKKFSDGAEVSKKDYETKLSAKSSALQRFIRDEGLVKSLTNERVMPELLPAVVALLRDKIEVDEDKLEGFVTDNGVRKPIADFVKAWVATDQGKHFVSAPVSKGGGSMGAGQEGGNGKAWKDMSLDEKSALILTNPELAKRCQAAG